MSKPLSQSRALASKLLMATFRALKDSGGSLPSKTLFEKLQSTLEFSDWDLEVYEKTGNTRWISILHFFSIDAIKSGFLNKEKGIWSLTKEGENAISLGELELLEACKKGYEIWKQKNPTPAKDKPTSKVSEEGISEQPPEELLENTIKAVNAGLASEILNSIKSCSPYFFEKLVVKLLVKMGYGGALASAARVTKKSGDGGIDGVIDEDKLGLDAIYIQAKRWEGSVGSDELNKFVGALAGQRAKKGVFITTSSFTKQADEFVKNIDYKVVLIDGITLAKLMIENNVGVSTVATYEMKRIDSDFFEEE